MPVHIAIKLVVLIILATYHPDLKDGTQSPPKIATFAMPPGAGLDDCEQTWTILLNSMDQKNIETLDHKCVEVDAHPRSNA